MSAIKDWMMDHEEYTWAAIEANLSLKDTIAYVKRHLTNTNENYVRELYEEFHREF